MFYIQIILFALKVWTEQPENIPTCLVTKPCPKGDVAEFFRKLQLFKLPTKGKGGDSADENNSAKQGEREGQKEADEGTTGERMANSPKLPPIEKSW